MSSSQQAYSKATSIIDLFLLLYKLSKDCFLSVKLMLNVETLSFVILLPTDVHFRISSLPYFDSSILVKAEIEGTCLEFLPAELEGSSQFFSSSRLDSPGHPGVSPF